MKKFGTIRIVAGAMLLLWAAGCGSSRRTAVEGYNDDMLMGKRVFVVLPTGSGVTLANPDAYAFSRGVAAAGAAEMLDGELRTMLVPSINQLLDSNTVLSYAGEPVGKMYPLDAATNFVDGQPRSWDNIEKGAHEANIDYLLVLAPIHFENTAAGEEGRGDEKVTADYALLDPQNKKLMTRGSLEFTVSDPRTPAMTYTKFAEELTRRLPFWVKEQK